ncbi:DUF460 domain-containing protein [Candidatus Woesearchaeota archaeon]|nr:DUF460 domain-containing protein [Candidatus Woesearchaeota archaeon]
MSSERQRSLLILGVDPGTTLGFAVLNLEGRCIKVGSAKDFGLPRLVLDVIQLGRIVVVATDKKKTPLSVAKVAASLGARVICPAYDLSLEEKRQLLDDYRQSDESIHAANAHQKDALASALHAFKQVRNSLAKIDVFVKEYSEDRLAVRLRESILKNSNLSYHSTAESIIAQDFAAKGTTSNTESGLIKNADPGFENADVKDIAGKLEFARQKIQRLRQEISLLIKSNKGLRQSLEQQGLKLAKYQQEPLISGFKDGDKKRHFHNAQIQKIQMVLKFRENRIRQLEKSLALQKDHLQQQARTAEKFTDFLASMHGKILVKRVRSLGLAELSETIAKLKIGENDYILLDSADSMSQKSLDLLSGKIRGIISDSGNKALREKFTLIPRNKISLHVLGDFALADAKQLESLAVREDLIDRLVDEYRKDRK